MKVRQFSILRSFKRIADILCYVAHSKERGQKTLQGRQRTAVFLRSLPPTHPFTKDAAHILFATSNSSGNLLSRDSYVSCFLCRWKLQVSFNFRGGEKVQFQELSHGKALQAGRQKKSAFYLNKETNTKENPSEACIADLATVLEHSV